MKNYLLFFLCLILISSCKSIDLRSYVKAPLMPAEVKFLPLDKREFGNNKIEMDMVDQNICEVMGPKYGYIHISIYSDVDTEWDFPFRLLSLFSLGASGIIGLPYSIVLADLNIRYEIRNSKDEEIAFFQGEGKARAPCAMYYGYDFYTASSKAITDAANQARKEIMAQLNKETVEEINRKLKLAGPIL
jgi:hypothetical protein